jgi:hypothetical protein
MSIESYNENQEQTPKLTNEEKDELKRECWRTVKDIKEWINNITDKNTPISKKQSMIKLIESSFNEWGKIIIREKNSNQNGPTYTRKSYSIDDFCNKLLNWEIDWSKFLQTNTIAKFPIWQFIRHEIQAPNGENFGKWIRKLNELTFDASVNEDISIWLEDLLHIDYNNAMTKNLASQNDKSKVDDENEAENLINSIT